MITYTYWLIRHTVFDRYLVIRNHDFRATHWTTSNDVFPYWETYYKFHNGIFLAMTSGLNQHYEVIHQFPKPPTLEYIQIHYPEFLI